MSPFLVLVLCAGNLVLTRPLSIFESQSQQSRTELKVLPEKFVLQPGERIHYTVLEDSEDGKPQFVDAMFTIENPEVIRLIKPTGVFEALKTGRTELSCALQRQNDELLLTWQVRRCSR